MSQEGPLGRDRELGEADAFLDRLPAGLSALALTGPAGIGKTTIWREAVHRAQARGYLVLSARPGQAEQSLSFAGLADLLGPVGQGALDSLAPLQRHALDVALLRAEPGPQPPAGAIPAAVLALLRHLTGAGPLILAVDDAQWLDDATAECLSFAVRRLEGLPVGVLVSVRADGDRPPTFDTVIPAGRRRDVPVGPLSVAALHAVLQRHLRHSLPRPVLVRVVTSCGGNPFYALEIARELARVGVPGAGEPLPVPGELHALVRSRMARLPQPTRDALLVAACLSQPTAATVDIDAIAPAEEAGIIRAGHDGRLRFGHPLLAAAVQDSVPAARRRAVHRQLAGRSEDPEQRAWHLAAAATAPDEAVAAALDAAADQAANRGARSAAIDFARRALQLTVDPTSDQAMRRAIRLAQHCVLGGGDLGEARAVLESALAACRNGDLRAELRLLLSYVFREESRPAEAYEPLLQAMAETTDRKLAARLHYTAIWMAEADATQGVRHCDAVLELLDEAADPGLYSDALMLRAYFRLLAGEGADDAAIERGLAIEQRAQAIGDRTVEDGYAARSDVPVIWPLLKDEFTRAVAIHTERLEWAHQIGQQPLEQSMAYFLAMLELWRGNWERAASWAAGLAEMVQQSRSANYWWNALVTRGIVDAHQGRLDHAEAAGQEALSLTNAEKPREAETRQLLGFIALSRRDPAGAAAHLSAADEIVVSLGQREPAQFRFHPDLIEALIGLGDPGRAQVQVDRLCERGRVFPRPWTLATGARCRGLLLAARGDLDGAAAALREALAHHDNLEMPFERGRTLLAFGQILRRRNERRQAQAALRDALSVFTALGAPIWAERAGEELKRIPARRARTGLTATEEQIARLAAAGLTNRQIAERAFISLKTVEANLSRAYAKLGVRSRAQLVLAMSQHDVQRNRVTAERGPVSSPPGQSPLRLAARHPLEHAMGPRRPPHNPVI